MIKEIRRVLILVGLLVLVLAIVGVKNWRQLKGLKAAEITLYRLVALEHALTQYAMQQGRFPSCETAECLAASLPELNKRPLALTDSWGRPFVISVRPARYMVLSLGSDGARDPVWRGAIDGGWKSEDDVVLQNGQMPQYPWGYLGGWYAPPWSAVVQSDLADAAVGALYVCVDFDSYPAPFARLLKDGKAVAADQRPGLFEFFAPAGVYDLEVTAVGRTIPPQKVIIHKDTVTTLEL